MSLVTVRPERDGDAPAIRGVNLAAFGQPAEADLVDALRRNRAVLLSMIAELDGELVGHILFSPVVIDRPGSQVAAVGLAPMAVAPGHQRAGIGSRLVRAGLDALRDAGQRAVVVVGHPGYYPRFGFIPGADRGVRWEHGHDDAFFVLELVAGSLAGGGVARYRPELDAV